MRAAWPGPPPVPEARAHLRAQARRTVALRPTAQARSRAAAACPWRDRGRHACGTGLNFPLIEERIGPAGTLIGVDLTTGMLRRANARAKRSGWSNVSLVQLDVTSLTRDRLQQAGALPHAQPVDAVLCTLGMSVVPQWQAAWEAMLALVRSGAAAALMDGSPPPRPTATTPLVYPLVWLGCRYFAADWTREPYKLAARDLERFEITWSKWGYVHAAGGTTRPSAATLPQTQPPPDSDTETSQ